MEDGILRGLQYCHKICCEKDGHCYKTKVWTDFGQGQGQPDIDKIVFYQSTTGEEIEVEEHVTQKLCDIVQSGLEELRVQKDREESRSELGLGDDVKGHGFLMVYIWYAHVQWRLKV